MQRFATSGREIATNPKCVGPGQELTSAVTFEFNGTRTLAARARYRLGIAL